MEYKNIINIKIKDFQLTENNTYKCLNKQFVDTEHLYVFDYNRGEIFHIDVPINTQNEDIPNILEEYGLKENDLDLSYLSLSYDIQWKNCFCMKDIRLEDVTPELEKRAFEEIENNK